ncbi:hypothetical protein D3C73_1321330 [compost metagenome]
MPEQVGRAHKGVARHLPTQGQFDLPARAASQRQQGLSGTGKAVENMLDLFDHLPRGGLAAGAQFALDLPVHHDQAERQRQDANAPGEKGAPAPAGGTFTAQGHVGVIFT